MVEFFNFSNNLRLANVHFKSLKCSHIPPHISKYLGGLELTGSFLQFHYLISHQTEQLEVYVYYSNNYSLAVNCVEKLKTQKDNLRYSFVSGSSICSGKFGTEFDIH